MFLYFPLVFNLFRPIIFSGIAASHMHFDAELVEKGTVVVQNNDKCLAALTFGQEYSYPLTFLGYHVALINSIILVFCAKLAYTKIPIILAY